MTPRKTFPPARSRRRKRRYRYRYGRIFLLLLIAGGILYGVFALTRAGVRWIIRKPEEALAPTQEVTTLPPETVPETTQPPVVISPFAGLQLHSQKVLLMKVDSGEVLYAQNEQTGIYPASLTKMMTAILALESIPDSNELIELENEDFLGLYEANASMAGFQPGEKVRAIDLIYGTLLSSGADCSVGLASHTAGSQEAFAERMNEKARELDMSHTHFVNPTGLHDTDHYSTVSDLALLLRYALKNDTFRTIFTTSAYTTSPTAAYEEGIPLRSTMFHMLQEASLDQGPLLGGKTGYTNQAGLCLASLANVNGEEYLLVTAGASPDDADTPYSILDALELYRRCGELS